MNSTHLGKSLRDLIDQTDLSQIASFDDEIPVEPELFYDDFGHLTHPRTRQPVTKLAPYQIKTWKGLHKYRRVLEVKSNKVGETTKWLLADFQLAILPSSNPLSTRGYDTLIIAQTKDHAREHLFTLRKLIPSSKKYGKYLITRQTELLLNDEVTKVTTLFIHNPENPNQPSRIIGLGLNNAGSILSWKNVKHIHISDPTAAEGDYSEAINSAMTRLANTDGTMVIETVPSVPQGKIYEMYQQYNGKKWQRGDFKVYTVTADDAVAAGVMTREFLEGEKRRLGVLFPQYYQAQFIAGAGNIFESQLVDLCVQHYDLAMKNGRKILAVDPAFGSSKFAILGIEKIGNVIYVKEAKQFDRPSPSVMLDMIAALYHRDGYQLCLVDSSQPGLIQDLNNGSKQTGRRPIAARSVNFRQKLSEMTMTAATAIKEQKVRIHPAFSELITQLKTVQFNEEGHPDKKRLSFDLGDCFLMAISESGTGGFRFIDIGSVFD